MTVLRSFIQLIVGGSKKHALNSVLRWLSLLRDTFNALQTHAHCTRKGLTVTLLTTQAGLCAMRLTRLKLQLEHAVRPVASPYFFALSTPTVIDAKFRLFHFDSVQRLPALTTRDKFRPSITALKRIRLHT